MHKLKTGCLKNLIITKIPTGPYEPSLFSKNIFIFSPTCWQTLTPFLLVTGCHILAPLLRASRVSCVEAQQGLDGTFGFERHNRNEDADDVSVDQQLLAHTLIFYLFFFTLGNNKHASVRRTAGLETLWFSPVPRCDCWEQNKCEISIFKKAVGCKLDPSHLFRLWWYEVLYCWSGF